MTSRRMLLGAAFLALAGAIPAGAQEAPATAPAPAARPRPRPRRRPAPPVSVAEAPFAPPQRGDPAPLPDPNLRALRDPNDGNPRLDAEIFTSRMPGTGATFEDEQAARYRDRLHRPAPGAALRVPF